MLGLDGNKFGPRRPLTNEIPRTIKDQPKICPQGPLGGFLEALGRLLGGSWGALGGLLGGSLGLYWAQEPTSHRKADSLDPLGPPNLEPKSNKNQHKINQKTSDLLMLFFD